MANSTTAVAVPAVDPNPTSNSLESDTRPFQPDPSPISAPPFPNPTPGSHPPLPSNLAPPLPSIQSSFRHAAPQFSTVGYQTPPPGVLTVSTPGAVSHAPPQLSGMTPHYAISGQPVRYASPPMPNGYPAIPQGAMPPPGVLRYPSPYGPLIRPAFPPRPLVGVMPQLARPPIFGIRGPIMPPGVRPTAIPIVTPAEKPQTTVYIGKISTTVENEFMLSLLQLCGPVKNWKRPQDPTGTLKGFGFCEFESAEGVLRALRLLNKLSVDGQELMVNVNQSTREYLERFVAKKSESSKNIEEPGTDTHNEEPTAAGGDTNETIKSSEESLKPSSDEQKKDDSEKLNKDNTDTANFGLVNNEDREADHEALEKLREMLEERLKSHPLPPPPPPPLVPVDGSGNSNSEQRSESRDRESDEDIAKNDSEEKNEEGSKPSSKNDRTEPGSPDRNKRNDRPRDRDYEQKREKERELERYEKEREQERFKREKDREYRSREDERRYKVREKDWEAKERERDHWRKREREREKERAQERKWEIIDQERDTDDNYGKKRKHKTSDEERKRRQREKEDDLADRLREEEEILEAKMKAAEDQQKKLQEALNVISGQPASSGLQKDVFLNETNFADQDKIDDQTFDHKPSRGVSEGEGVLAIGIVEEPVISSNAASDMRQNSNGPTRKLGFGLSGSGKRAAVPSVFNADEDEEAHKDKKMRPLVPIDYTTEEQNTVEPSVSEFPSANVVAATEFVKRISNVNPKEEKPDVEKEKNRRSNERSSQRDRGRHEEETNSTRGERDRASKKPENPKLLDAKQLIDTIPKTKNELFTYEINWVVYEQNALHERLRPWIAKKITDFLGEEEVTLVDYIVSSTQEHVDAGEMLERLQTILDDEAEMFVLKMWRMLIFEIKKVETGLTPKLKA